MVILFCIYKYIYEDFRLSDLAERKKHSYIFFFLNVCFVKNNYVNICPMFLCAFYLDGLNKRTMKQDCGFLFGMYGCLSLLSACTSPFTVFRTYPERNHLFVLVVFSILIFLFLFRALFNCPEKLWICGTNHWKLYEDNPLSESDSNAWLFVPYNP